MCRLCRSQQEDVVWSASMETTIYVSTVFSWFKGKGVGGIKAHIRNLFRVDINIITKRKQLGARRKWDPNFNILSITWNPAGDYPSYYNEEKLEYATKKITETYDVYVMFWEPFEWIIVTECVFLWCKYEWIRYTVLWI